MNLNASLLGFAFLSLAACSASTDDSSTSDDALEQSADTGYVWVQGAIAADSTAEALHAAINASGPDARPYGVVAGFGAQSILPRLDDYGIYCALSVAEGGEQMWDRAQCLLSVLVHKSQITQKANGAVSVTMNGKLAIKIRQELDSSQWPRNGSSTDSAVLSCSAAASSCITTVTDPHITPATEDAVMDVVPKVN